MRIEADLERCEGHVCCVMESGHLFDIDEAGKVIVMVANPAPDQAPAARAAIAQCPVAALAIIED